MSCRILHQFLDLLRSRTILTLTDEPRFINPLSKDFCTSLVAVRDADLEGVIVEPRIQWFARTLVFVPNKLEKRLAICEASAWVEHNSVGRADCFIQALDLEAAGIAQVE